MTDELEKNIFITGYMTAVRDMMPWWITSLDERNAKAEKAYEVMLKRQEEYKNEK
jgi:hypothetical protein